MFWVFNCCPSTCGQRVVEETSQRQGKSLNSAARLMDQVLLPTTWAYPDKTILQIIQARTKQSNKNTTKTCGKWLESAIMKFRNTIVTRMRQVHIYTTCEASPNLSILRTALEKTDLSWIFASAMVAKEYRVDLLSQWLTFWTFGDSIFSRENKVQTFFSGSIG